MSVSAARLRSPEEGSTPSPVSDSETAAERLTDDLLLEILSRLPAKSLCRFKCVSNHWLGLIDHPDHRKKLPQTLAGFFYTSSTVDGWVKGVEVPVHFTNVSGRRRDISFALLSKSNHPRFSLYDCCNGLLLGVWWNDFTYFVFNPATQKWVAFENYPQSQSISPSLFFDPALSEHFHVFDWVYEEGNEWEWDERDGPDLVGVAVYSSETGEWVYKEKTWNDHIRLTDAPKTVFLNGYVHFLADGHEESDCLAVVDTKGETWMNFPVPSGLHKGFIERSQGRLNYANFQRDEDSAALRLVVYVLENYQSKNWILTHSAETSYMFGGIDVQLDVDFYWVAIHQDCNLVFFIAGCDHTLLCYNMDHRQVKVISNIQEGNPPYLPYVPFYAELPSLHI